MAEKILFEQSYEKQKHGLLTETLDRLRPIYTEEELRALRIDSIKRDMLSLGSGRGFVNRDILETILGNLLECVAPGSHNAPDPQYQKRDLAEAVEEVVDQLYAMIAQSFLAVSESPRLEEAVETTFALLWDLPRLKTRARWNRFASLRDPAVWDAYLLHRGVSHEKLAELNIGAHVDSAIVERDFEPYQEFLNSLGLGFAFDYQMQLVVSAYPGWRVLFYHDVAHALTRVGELDDSPDLHQIPVPLLPRAIAELGGRYYQADLHPETRIGDANFLEHPHRGITTGQTGIIGSGCAMYPCTLGGLSVKVKQRHPDVGNFVQIGTDAGIFGPVKIGDYSSIGTNTEMYGFIEMGEGCRIGSSVIIGTIKSEANRPGVIRLGKRVHVGDSTIIENTSAIDLIIPDQSEVPARSHVANDGFGHPRFIA